MNQAVERAQAYLAEFERFEKHSNGALPFRELRRAAIARFGKLGFPAANQEQWRFTPLAPLLQHTFSAGPVDPAPSNRQREARYDAEPGVTLLLVNGAAPMLLTESRLPGGLLICGLADAWKQHPALVEPHFGRQADDGAFTSLNTAFCPDGAFVYIPPRLNVEAPIHIRFVVDAQHADRLHSWHRRTLIVCGESSNAIVVESFLGSAGMTYFTNAVSEIALAPKARLEHCKLLREGNEAFHIHELGIRQAEGSRFTSCSISMGAKWARNQVRAQLDGENGECTLNGLYMADGDRLVDNHTRIDHNQPHCASHELYKGILNDRARAVFNGKIYVHQDAQKTDAKQRSQTLLLSDDAVIDAKPELEIFADDVKCTHGASIGQLDEEAIFYLRTRGIDREAAQRLLIYAFANDILDRLPIESLRSQLAGELSPLASEPAAPSEPAA